MITKQAVKVSVEGQNTDAIVAALEKQIDLVLQLYAAAPVIRIPQRTLFAPYELGDIVPVRSKLLQMYREAGWTVRVEYDSPIGYVLAFS